MIAAIDAVLQELMTGARPIPLDVLALQSALKASVQSLFAQAEWLCLAAAPTFAIMALLTSIHGGQQPDMLCSAGHGASPLTGMVPMYMLMSAFHLAALAGATLQPAKRRPLDLGGINE